MARRRNRKHKVAPERALLVAPLNPNAEPIPIPMGRTSTDKGESSNSFGGVTITPPDDHEGNWRAQDLDTATLDQLTPRELLDMLIDLSPEISRATWDFQRLCNPGWEYKVYELGPEDTESEAGMLAISEFFAVLRDNYGSIDIIFNRLFIGAYLRGAFCSELVVGPDGYAVDLATPDPFSIRFRKIQHPQRGEVWQPGQVSGQDFVPLDIPTFKYLPVDPAPANPYGRSLAAPALFTGIFLLSVMHDVKRIVMQQGYPRMDIKINTEQAIDSYSYDPQNFKTLGEYIGGAVDRVRTVYGALEPDDAFIHTDMIEIGSAVGAIDANAITAITGLIDKLEKTVTRGLKSNSLIMDTGGNTGETDSNRRWEIHAAGVKSLQHLCENMIELQLSLVLQARGVQGRVWFRFAELRASEMFRDEQTRTLNIQNTRSEYEAGWISQDEAALKTVKHLPFAPAPLMGQGETELVQDNNDGNEDLSQKQDDRSAPNPLTRELEALLEE